MSAQTRRWFTVALLAAVFGGVFAAFSTLDFIQHLDRQLHPLHCSFIPGLASETATGEAGCRAVMNSRFSSFLRDSEWGGVPVSLLALAVFAYLSFLVLEMGLRGRLGDKAETAYLLLAAGLPLGTSIIFFSLAMIEVHALCKLCVGIYLSSIAFFVSCLMLHREARETWSGEAKKRRMLYFAEGVFFVIAAVVIYLAVLPEYRDKVLSCGELKKTEDRQHALLEVHGGTGAPILEVIDPLCPACKAFVGTLESQDFGAGQPWQVLFFPLDTECNWMLTQSMHPGACMVSRALLCAGKDFSAMWRYVFDNQEDFRITASKAPNEVKQKLMTRFSGIDRCIDAPETTIRLNNMLRYAMQNRLPILTPQLYVGGRRLCDEDTDLGLPYALGVLGAETKARPGVTR